MTQTNDPPLISSLELIPDANEKADLDAPSGSGGKLVIGQAPNITITETTVVADAAERLALEVQEGDVAVQTNVSSSFIFTGGDNIAPNWQTLDFDAVGAISGEDISPNNITALGQLSGQSLSVTGAINGADTSAAAAGEALTANGSGSLQFASVGGIEEVATFGDLPTIDPPQLAYVTGEQEYYSSTPISGTTYDIASSEFTVDTSINSQDQGPRDIAWNDDGSQFYELDRSVDKIFQYTVSSSYDISSMTLSTSINTQDGQPTGIAWNNNGSRLYEVGEDNDEIYQYSVTTPYDVSSATLSASVDAGDGNPSDIAWNDDGSALYVAGHDADKIFQYNVSTPFDITNKSLSTSADSQSFVITGIAWNDDGSRLLEVDEFTGKIYQHSLSTPYDVSSRTLSTQIDSQDGEPQGITWNDDGSRLYEIGRNTNKIYQYTLTTGGWEAF